MNSDAASQFRLSDKRNTAEFKAVRNANVLLRKCRDCSATHGFLLF